MVIKNGSKKDVLIEGTRSKVSILNDNGLIVKIDPNDIIINKPGEYEYSDVNITALELTTDTFTAKTNFLRLSLEGIDIGVVLSDIPSERESLKDIANIFILVVSGTVSLDGIKRLLTYFEPQALIFVNVTDEAQLQKDLSIVNVTKDKQFKFKSTDFRTDDAAVMMNTYILN